MTYNFKPLAELGWFVIVAIVTQVMQILVDFDPTLVTDWRAWLVALGAAAVRALAGAVLSWLGKRAITAG